MAFVLDDAAVPMTASHSLNDDYPNQPTTELGLESPEVNPLIPSSSYSSPSWNCNGILVCVRVRPLSVVERADPSIKTAVDCLHDHIILDLSVGKNANRYFGAKHAMPKPLQFPFHHVFHPRSTQSEVFADSCAPMVHGAFQGVNGAVMAYGATGSGKTHSMFGCGMSAPGVIFQAVQLLFAEKERRLEESPGMCIRFNCSFVEVYNEEVYDLLNTASRTKPLQVQDVGEDRNTTCTNQESFVLKGVTSVIPRDVEDFVSIVERGLKNRAVASTNANFQSSRSHAIVTVEVEVKDREESSRGTIARLRFCDLAGCERAAQLASSNQRLKEGAKINHSLLELGRVTQALALRSLKAAAVAAAGVSKVSSSQSTNNSFISWRGSKLTRLMRDCLEDNCRTTLLVCISPTSASLEDSRNAMFFAMKAKEVQLTARANEYKVDTPEIAKEQSRMIERMRDVITAMRDILKAKTGSCVVEGVDHDTAAEFGLSCDGTMPTNGVRAGSKRGASQPNNNTEVPTSSIDAQQQMTIPSTTSAENLNSLSYLKQQVYQEPQYATLREQLKVVSEMKSRLHLQLKDHNQTCKDLEISVRNETSQLADFVARQSADPYSATGNEPPPLSIVNAQARIKDFIQRKRDVSRQCELLEKELRSMDDKYSEVRKQLQKGKSDFVIELVLERANLLDSTTAAEALAAQYHQEKWLEVKRLAEYQTNQERLTAAMHGLLKYAPADCAERRQAAVALAFAEMSRLDTASMLDGFRKKLSELQTGLNHHNIGGRSTSANTYAENSSFTSAGAGSPRGNGSSNTTVPSRRIISTTTHKEKKESVSFTITSDHGRRATPATSSSGASEHMSADGSGSSTPNQVVLSPSSHVTMPSQKQVNKQQLRSSLPVSSNITSATNTFVGGNNGVSAFSGGGAFARSMSLATALTQSPALLKRAAPTWSSTSSSSFAASAAPMRKPPVPFTSGAAASGGDTRTMSSGGISVKTSSSGNTLLGSTGRALPSSK